MFEQFGALERVDFYDDIRKDFSATRARECTARIVEKTEKNVYFPEVPISRVFTYTCTRVVNVAELQFV